MPYKYEYNKSPRCNRFATITVYFLPIKRSRVPPIASPITENIEESPEKEKLLNYIPTCESYHKMNRFLIHAEKIN